MVAVNELDPGRQLRKVEFRVATRVETGGGKEAPVTPTLLEPYRARLEELEVDRGAPFSAGLVFHFLRHRKPACYFSSNEEAVRGDWRFSKHFASLAEEAEGLVNLWKSDGRVCEYCLGFDVAGNEEELPDWLLYIVLGRLRSRLDRNQMIGHRGKPKEVGFCVHAGERFSHVLLGLSRVESALRFLRPKHFDRIGHAVVLDSRLKRQLDTPAGNEEWAFSVIRCFERLTAADQQALNRSVIEIKRELGYVVDRARASGLAQSAATEFGAFVQNEMMLTDAIHILDDSDRVLGLGFPFESPEESMRKCSSVAERFVVFLLSNPVYAEWSTQDSIRSDPEDHVLEAYRKLLLRQISEANIVIESCPTSNCRVPLTAGNGAYADHPAVSPDWRGPIGPQVSISTDDPLQFCTSLELELWSLFWGVEQSEGGEAAKNWLRLRLEHGNEASFLRYRGVLDAGLEVLGRNADGPDLEVRELEALRPPSVAAFGGWT
ncbi:MAG: hypothetical protein AMXMBFR36_04190 [Acidobacteriota bacterium]